MTSDELLRKALNLPLEERAGLARNIIASLEGAADPDASDAWISEIERRVMEIQDGTADLVDWKQVRKGISERLQKKS